MSGAVVSDSVILDNVVVESGAEVRYAIVDSGTTIGKDCKIGEDITDISKVAVVGADICVPDGTVVPAGAMISKSSDLNKEDN
jgi:ADP-glucose pyrophosphorylase